MRPASIVNFERVLLLIVLFSVASAVIEWDRTMAQLAAQGVGAGALIALLGALILLIVLLGWLIARRRSNKARWAYVLLIVLMIGISVPSGSAMFNAGALTIALNLFFLLLLLLSIVLLFRSDANAWLAGRGDDSAA
jgi:hypothetical protein